MYMAIHISNPYVEAKLREFARRMEVSVTEAVALAIDAHASAVNERQFDIVRKLGQLQDEAASYPDGVFKADKAFYDWLNDE
jgi:hypothetical protein